METDQKVAEQLLAHAKRQTHALEMINNLLWFLVTASLVAVVLWVVAIN
jgi:hypothetical protein